MKCKPSAHIIIMHLHYISTAIASCCNMINPQCACVRVIAVSCVCLTVCLSVCVSVTTILGQALI